MRKKFSIFQFFPCLALIIFTSIPQQIFGMDTLYSYFYPQEEPTIKSKIELTLSLIGGAIEKSASLTSLEENSPQQKSPQKIKKQVSFPKQKSSAFSAKNVDELNDLKSFFSPAFETTLCLESNHSYPKWYTSPEWYTFLQNIQNLDTLKFGESMDIFTMGLTSFSEHLKITNLKHLQFDNFYFDVGPENLKDLSTLLQRNQQSLETFSISSGDIESRHITPFMKEFPPLPLLHTFHFCSPYNNNDLQNVARVLKNNPFLKDVQILGQFTEAEKDGYEETMDILKKSENLEKLTLYFDNNMIILELIDILNSPKKRGLKELNFSTQWNADNKWNSSIISHFGKAIGSQKNLEKLGITQIEEGSSAFFFKGISDNLARNSVLSTFIALNLNADLTNNVGMKAFGEFLETNQSLHHIEINSLQNQASAQILVDALTKRRNPLDTLQIYYWSTTPKIQSLFSPLCDKTQIIINND